MSRTRERTGWRREHPSSHTRAQAPGDACSPSSNRWSIRQLPTPQPRARRAMLTCATSGCRRHACRSCRLCVARGRARLSQQPRRWHPPLGSSTQRSGAGTPPPRARGSSTSSTTNCSSRRGRGRGGCGALATASGGSDWASVKPGDRRRRAEGTHRRRRALQLLAAQRRTHSPCCCSCCTPPPPWLPGGLGVAQTRSTSPCDRDGAAAQGGTHP